jgi:preprotein translocase subunit SecG
VGVLLNLATAAVLAFIGFRLVEASRYATTRRARAHTAEILRGLRPHHFVLAIPVLGLVVLTFAVLLQIPGMSFGWFTAIGGEGNPVFGSTKSTAGTPLEVVVPVVFIALLIPALPLLVEREEQIFRRGSEHRTTAGRIWRGVLFGLVHAVIGIPIGAALALSIGGWYFTWAYLRGYRAGGETEALLESTRSHLAYNIIIVTLVLVSIVGGALTS